MGKKALSQGMKNFKKLRTEEHKLTQAVDAFNDAKQGYTYTVHGPGRARARPYFADPDPGP